MPEEIHAAAIIQKSIRRKIAMIREQGPQKVEPLFVSPTRSTPGGDATENKSIMLDSDDDKAVLKTLQNIQNRVITDFD